MKTKKLAITVCCILLAAFTLGATGAVRVTAARTRENAGADRLIGMFVTREHLGLFDTDRFLEENIGRLSRGDSGMSVSADEYQGRLYAAVTEVAETDAETGEVSVSKEYVFEGVAGIRMFAAEVTDEHGTYRSMSADEGLCESGVHISSTEAGDSLYLKGTVYLVPQGEDTVLYCNPVYQTPEGAVYAVPGQGCCFTDASQAGTATTEKIAESRKVTPGGSGIETEAELTVCVTEEPQKSAILEYGTGGELLVRTEYAAGDFPESYDVSPDTAYLVVETAVRSGETARTLYGVEDGYVSALKMGEGGLCVMQGCTLNR